ncbi:MAG: 3-deoxy-8-phosphooctulonate synthase [Alphaproteobacteria bacterium]|nr:3-deoxy-8-phosphooctulonate synthase [Alphaproteobacteria bacterium]
MQQKSVSAGSVVFANDKPFSLIAGPCQVESRAHAFEMAHAIKEIAHGLGIGVVFKASYDKANRTSLGATRGIGIDQGLAILSDIREEVGIPVLTDVHERAHCAPAAQAVDILQIPAFLCRQTDLLVAAAETGAVVNVKKGQFLAPWDMKNVATKLTESGNDKVILTDRGTSFGYNTLVTDIRGLPRMAADTGLPVVIDATHSVQQPGGQGGSSGGQREFVPVIARAAIAVGVAGVFMEVHDDPDNTTSSDGPNMVRLREFKGILETLSALDGIAKAHPVTL